MALPTNLVGKQRLDVLTATDWNAGFKEVARLDTDKLDKAGGAITGPLTLSGPVTVNGSLQASSIVLPDGAITPAMTGMHRIDIGPVEWPLSHRATMEIERYPPGTPPTGVPAYIRVLSTSSLATIRVVDDFIWDTAFGAPDADGTHSPSVMSRGLLLTTDARATFSLTLAVFTSIAPTTFTPTLRIFAVGTGGL